MTSETSANVAPLWVNLSLLMQRPTGISTYALNVVPQLRSLSPTLLTAQGERFPGFSIIETPPQLTPEFGSRGHAQRLWWTQMKLPKRMALGGGTRLGANRPLTKSLTNSPLLFSPVPEMPLGRGCRAVVMVHDFIPLRFPRWRSPLTQYFRWVVPQVLRQAVHLVCNSESTAADIMQFGGVPSDRITPIPLAYDADHFRPLALPRRNYFLYLGRQDPYKNLTTLITAFAQLPQQDCELWIAGSADPRFVPQLQAQALALGLGERVKFLAYVAYDDLPQLLSQAQALVFPSLWEGFGLPLLEAMGCGTPVIAGKLAALPEVGGDAVLWVDVTRPEAIAQAMQRLLQEPQLAAQLRAAGLQQAKQFSWVQTGQRTAEVLKQWI